MKKNYFMNIILLVLIVIGGIYFLYPLVTNKDGFPSSTETYTNAELGLEFTYRSGPDGYVIQELTSSDPAQDLLKTIVIMRTEDATQAIPVGGEGPATITIQVLRNSKKQSAAVWAAANNIYSNINLKLGEVSEYVLGGANAVRYSATGLYNSDNVVAAHGENIYVVTGNYLEVESDLRKDFSPLLKSIKFIPQPGQN